MIQGVIRSFLKASGNYSDSFTSSLLAKDGVPVSSEEEDIIRWCAGGLYVGASDTVRLYQNPYFLMNHNAHHPTAYYFGLRRYQPLHLSYY